MTGEEMLKMHDLERENVELKQALDCKTNKLTAALNALRDRTIQLNCLQVLFDALQRETSIPGR